MSKERDVLRRFLIGNHLRGEWIRLNTTWRTVLNRTDYPEAVSQYLGQALAATALLSATIKFDGKMTLQIRGTGPLHLLVVQVNSNRGVRCTAKWRNTLPDEISSLHDVFGTDAQLLMSVNTSGGQERYQGIVDLRGSSLSEALETFFLQSEQLPSYFWLHSDMTCVAGLMIQKMPGAPEDDDSLNRVKMLSDTVTAHELINLDAEQLLWRLYHEEGVSLYEPQGVHFECYCSTEKTRHLVQSLGAEEAKHILSEEGAITITCEFCHACYTFDAIDVAQIFNADATGHDGNQTRH